MITYDQACKKAYNFFRAYTFKTAFRGIIRAYKMKNGWGFLPDTGKEPVYGGPSFIIVDVTGNLFDIDIIWIIYKVNDLRKIDPDLYPISLPEKYMSNRFRRYKHRYLDIHNTTALKLNENFLTRIARGENVLCVQCGEGFYSPKVSYYHLNHIYKCSKCEAEIEFDPTSICGWKQRSGIIYDTVEDTEYYQSIVDSVEEQAYQVSIDRHYDQFLKDRKNNLTQHEVFLKEKKRILKEVYDINWEPEINLNPNIDLLWMKHPWRLVYPKMRAFIYSFEGAPWNEECKSALTGFTKLGIECILFSTNEELDKRSPVDIVVGGMLIMEHVLNQDGILRPNLNYPSSLDSYLGRKIWIDKLSSIRESSFPLFMKPLEEKTADGAVIHDAGDMSVFSHLDENAMMLCSEVINFVSEWRCFIRYGKIIGIKFYKGDEFAVYDESVIRQAVKECTELTNGCSLDFGVTDSGRTLLIEMNDGYALGSYGLEPVLYAELLNARWSELHHTEDYLVSVAIKGTGD